MAGNHQHAVAVIDDDPAVLGSLRFMLEAAGHQVEVYASAAAFLEDRAVRPAQHMPAMTGLELADHLRGKGRLIPTVHITAHASTTIVRRAAELGVEKVFEKPLAERDVLGFVEVHRGIAP